MNMVDSKPGMAASAISLLLAATERIEGKIALKTGLSAFLGWSLGYGMSLMIGQEDTITHGLWCALAAIVVQQAYLGSTYRSAWTRFLGVLIGCATGGIFTKVLGSTPITLGFSVYLTVAACSFFNLRESIRIACMSVAVVMVLYSAHPNVSPWLFAFYRFLDSVMGIAAAVVVAHVFWPQQAQRKIEDNLGDAMEALSVMYRASAKTSSPSKADQDVWKKAEGQLLCAMAVNKGYLDESRLELLSRYADVGPWINLTRQMDLLYEGTKTLYGINKSHLGEILDEGLSMQALQMNQLNELAIYRMGRNLREHQIFRPSVDLEETLEALIAEAARFRATKTTRKYGLEDVEGFFVYFFQLKMIAEGLIEMQNSVKAILEND